MRRQRCAKCRDRPRLTLNVQIVAVVTGDPPLTIRNRCGRGHGACANGGSWSSSMSMCPLSDRPGCGWRRVAVAVIVGSAAPVPTPVDPERPPAGILDALPGGGRSPGRPVRKIDAAVGHIPAVAGADRPRRAQRHQRLLRRDVSPAAAAVVCERDVVAGGPLCVDGRRVAYSGGLARRRRRRRNRTKMATRPRGINGQPAGSLSGVQPGIDRQSREGAFDPALCRAVMRQSGRGRSAAAIRSKRHSGPCPVPRGLSCIAGALASRHGP
jgi:hypothetical protein